jgi:hypothetical protein
MKNDPYTSLADETYFMQQEQDAHYDKIAVEDFEATVDKFMSLMNVSRGTAIRIMMDNEHEDGWAFYTEDDVDRFIAHHYGLPKDCDQYRECFNVGLKNITEFDYF